MAPAAPRQVPLRRVKIWSNPCLGTEDEQKLVFYLLQHLALPSVAVPTAARTAAVVGGLLHPSGRAAPRARAVRSAGFWTRGVPAQPLAFLCLA